MMREVAKGCKDDQPPSGVPGYTKALSSGYFQVAFGFLPATQFFQRGFYLPNLCFVQGFSAEAHRLIWGLMDAWGERAAAIAEIEQLKIDKTAALVAVEQD